MQQHTPTPGNSFVFVLVHHRDGTIRVWRTFDVGNKKNYYLDTALALLQKHGGQVLRKKSSVVYKILANFHAHLHLVKKGTFNPLHELVNMLPSIQNDISVNALSFELVGHCSHRYSELCRLGNYPADNRENFNIRSLESALNGANPTTVIIDEGQYDQTRFLLTTRNIKDLYNILRDRVGFYED